MSAGKPTHDEENGGVGVEADAIGIVRDIVLTQPPKSIDTIKAAADVAKRALFEGRIRRRAYELWEIDGCPSGDGTQYWVQAECEMLAEAAKRAEAPEC